MAGQFVKRIFSQNIFSSVKYIILFSKDKRQDERREQSPNVTKKNDQSPVLMNTLFSS